MARKHDRLTALLTGWLTVSVVAEMLGVTDTWIRTLGDRGELGMIETPLGRLFDPQVVEQEQARRAGR